MSHAVLIENYNIHNIISFQLVNSNAAGLLKNINPEYEYFRVEKEVDPDFRITISMSPKKNGEHKFLKYRFEKRYASWEVGIFEYENGFVDLTIVPHLDGFRKLFEYSALKNLYVRSLLYYCLIKNGFTLIHSSAVNIRGEAYVFVGRPGVFKTSIIMDILRRPGSSFLGEENCVLKDGNIYAFPLNIQSLDYKIKYYKNENPPSSIRKFMLGLFLLKNKNYNISISNPCKPCKIFYLEKKVEFECEKIKLEDIIDKFTSNEIEEIEITPTHTFSGISNNYFSEYLQWMGMMGFVKKTIRDIFIKDISNSDIYSVSMPRSYDPSLINEFLRA